MSNPKTLEEYRKVYKPFRPYEITDASRQRVAEHIKDLVAAQNGSDVDDYVLGEPPKLERYLPELPSGSRLLILGTGCGREVQHALSKGYDAYGTTLGSRNVEFSVDVLGLEAGRVVECMNEALPFGHDYFDAVAGFQVFEHAFAPLLFVIEQRRVLRMGGTLVLEWPPAMNYTMGENPHHFICYTPGQAKALFQKAGFTNISVYFEWSGVTYPVPEDKMWDGTGMFDFNGQTIEAHLCIKGTKAHSSNWTSK
jgi:SAM-dependent methyltransferase